MTSPRLDIEVLRELGRGATGNVVHARLLTPLGEWPAGTELAVKTMHPELRGDPAARAAFEAEAAAGAAIRDASLVRVLHFSPGEAGGDPPQLVMEYVGGRSLREILDDTGPLPEPLARRVAAQVSGALAALHGAGLTHCDLKPENIRLDDEGRAVLVDLGFVRPIRLDAQGSGPGTPLYLAPERFEGAPPSPAGEVFSLALVLYEAVTGRHPFREWGRSMAGASRLASSREILRLGQEHAGTDPRAALFVAPSRHLPQLSPFLDRLLEEGLSRDPAGRPSARELAERFGEGEAGPWWRSQLQRRPDDLTGGAGNRAQVHLTPLVGRERELRTLMAARERAHGSRVAGSESEPRGGVVWLTGSAGSGKSRLISDLATRARELPSPPLFLYGRCSSFDQSQAAGPVMALVRRWLHLPTETPPREREREILERLIPPREASVLLSVLDPDFHGTLAGALPVALSTWLLAVAERQPVIVFLDDVQRAATDTLIALGRIAERLPGNPVLLILGLREDEDPTDGPEFERLREKLEQRPQLVLESLDLEPLDEEAVTALVTRLFHHTVPRLRLGHELWRRSRGNPGLIAELLRDLLDQGTAHPHPGDPGQLQLDINPEQLPLPGSLRHTIAERYRRLDDVDRRWLERLAVVGGRIDPEFLMAAFPPVQRAEIDAQLSRLVSRGWLVPIGTRYRFARPALREAVYRSLSERRRVLLHGAAAKALAGGANVKISVADGYQRAFHLRAAGHHSSLLRVLGPLLEEIVRRGQAQRIHTLASWGLEALERLASTPNRARLRIELLELAADAVDRLGRRQEQRELLDDLADLELSPERDPELAARVYLLHGRYAAAIGQYGLARGMLRNAGQLAGQAGAQGLQSESLRRLAAVQGHVGEMAAARKLARAAARAGQTPQQVALAWLARVQLDALEDRVEEGLRTLDRALRLLRRKADPLPLGIVAYAQMLRARLWRSCGMPGRALGAARRALALAMQTGERRLEAEAGARLGGLLLDLDRGEEAEAYLREAHLLSLEIEDLRGEILSSLWLGILLWEQSDPEARQRVERAARLAEEIGFYRPLALADALLSRIEWLGRGSQKALEIGQRSIEILDSHGAEHFDRIVITGTRALILESCGQRTAAAKLIGALKQRMVRDNARTTTASLRQSQRLYAGRLLKAVLSPQGPVYPRQAMARVLP